MLKRFCNQTVLLVLIFVSLIAIYVISNYSRWTITRGESSAYEILNDIVLLQSEFKKRALLDRNGNKVGEFADLELLLKSNIVIRNLKWDS
ncbi:hypothetical protein [Candidatus Uabimicrobium sp. HlEnr_7]|uniref:hypothetical protein n=1 Tax=Candidatus Uabimicrobium helgolandensis TaxID=3095367 RepID=UPI00355632A1